MKSFTQLALSILFALALGGIAEAQVTLNGPLRVTDSLNGGKAIDIPAGKSVVVKDFTANPNATAAVFFNISQNKSKRGSDGNDYFPGTFDGKNVFISRDAMIQGLSAPAAAPAKTPTADPKSTVNRLDEMNKATGKGPNGSPSCINCTHSAGQDVDEFGPMKSDDELRKYVCLFHKYTPKTGVGEQNFEMLLPIMKEIAAKERIPVAYIACIIQNESQFEVLTNGYCGANGLGGKDACHGLGHFEIPTAKSFSASSLEIAMPLLQKRNLTPRSEASVTNALLVCSQKGFTEEVAIYQTAAIVSYAKYLMSLRSGAAGLNGLLLAAAGHNVGQGAVSGVPYSAFKSNNTNWVSGAVFTPNGNQNARAKNYLRNLERCMQPGNFDARDGGHSKPDHASCGG